MVAIVLIIIGGMGGSDKLKRQILRHSEVEKKYSEMTFRQKVEKSLLNNKS